MTNDLISSVGYEEVKPILNEDENVYRKVNDHDINMCLESFKRYKLQAVNEKKFDTDVFKQQLEETFEAAGYRQNSMHKRSEIILITDASVGDFINISASLKEIRRIYENAYIVLVCYPRAAPLVETCPYINEVIFNSRSFNLLDFLAKYEWNINISEKLLRHRFDLCFVFGHYPSSYMLSFMSGAKERVSYGLDNPLCQGHPFAKYYPVTSEFLSVKVPNQKKSNDVGDIYLGILDNFLCVPVKNRNKEIWFRPGERNELEKVIQVKLGKWVDKFLRIAIGIGGTIQRKHWPKQDYSILMKKLLTVNDEYRFLLIGGPEEKEDAEEIINTVGREYAADFTTGFDFRQTAGIINNCAYYIGNDTSTLHIASVFGLPILTPNCFPASLGLDKYTIPVKYTPHNVPMVMVLPKEPLPECADSHDEYGCRIWDKPHCITQITPELMLEGFRLLQKMKEKGIIDVRYIK